MINNIGGVVVLIIVVLASVRTIFDVADGFGFLPTRLKNLLKVKRIREVNEILQEVGLLSKYDQISSFSDRLFHGERHLINNEEAYKAIDFFIIESIEKGDYQIDSNTVQRVEYFINLRKTYYNNEENLIKIAKAFASYIYYESKKENIYYDYIATPSTSALVLNFVVSKILGKPLLVFDINTGTKNNNLDWFLVGQNTSTNLSNTKAIIVDESFVNGGELSDVYDFLTKHSIKSGHLFAIFRRSEGNTKNYPNLYKNVKYHVMRELGNDELANAGKKPW
ncbi:uncharacterized protein TOL2_C25940 [Desulfobacula toluolica Tol2]|uniref:Uncharacterized protein n=2 Tax=Desulfobacula toluolica TaxID=28223 RepID=K0NL90_DESTT|nr:uncharacterized protein TOL2_C25940 [Desulfobacula toluolica Tol2]